MRLLIARSMMLLAMLVCVPAAQAQSMLAASAAGGGKEQAEIRLPEELTPETVRALVSRLSDKEVRQLLLQHLDAVAKREAEAGQSDGRAIHELIASWGAGVYESVGKAITGLPSMAGGLGRAIGTFVDRRGASGTWWFLLALAIGGSAGLAAYALVLRSPLRRYVRRADAEAGLGETLRVLAVRLAVDILALAAFVIVAVLVHKLLLTPEDRPITQLFLVNLVAIPLAAIALSRFMLSPRAPELRLVHADDETAAYLHRNTVGIALLAGFSIFVTNFSAFNGVPMSETPLTFWLNLAIFVWLAVTVLRARAGITRMLAGNEDDATPLEMRAARVYPVVMVVLIAAVWLLVEVLASQGQYQLLHGGRQFVTLALLAAVPAVDTMIRGLVRHLVPPMRGEGPAAEQAYRSTKRSYIRIGRAVWFALAVVLIAGQWGIDFANLASAGLGAQLAGRFIGALMILAAGYLAWELATLWLNRKLAAERTAAGFDLTADEPGGGEGGGAGGSRLSTVLPILRLTVQTGIIVMTVLVALGNLGVDITPLLAGAGIVGIAIGFGAQTLVRDVVSGIFFLVDDAFRVGEYIVIGDTVGTVEKLSIRSLQLRHHGGAIHTVPYGEIPKVTNNSRDWVIMKLKFTFPFDTDVEKVRKIFKKVGQEMLEAPYAGDLIQTFKSQGVYQVDDVGIVIRGKFMTRPGAQFVIRKDIYARVQRALDAAGIQFARKEVRVQIPGLQERPDLSEDQKTAVAAVAAEAAEAAAKPEPAKG